MPTVINYNRGRLSNTTDTSTIALTLDEPELLVSLGIFVSEPTNFLNIISTVGADLSTAATGALFEITVDDVVVGSADMAGPDGENDGTVTFQTILENVPVGHHVIQLFATLEGDAGATGTIDGPVTVSAWVLA